MNTDERDRIALGIAEVLIDGAILAGETPDADRIAETVAVLMAGIADPEDDADG